MTGYVGITQSVAAVSQKLVRHSTINQAILTAHTRDVLLVQSISLPLELIVLSVDGTCTGEDKTSKLLTLSHVHVVSPALENPS